MSNVEPHKRQRTAPSSSSTSRFHANIPSPPQDAPPPLDHSKSFSNNSLGKTPTSPVQQHGTIPPVPMPGAPYYPPSGSMMPMPPPPPPLAPPSGISSEDANVVNRELFVGNTPPGTSEQLLVQFLNGAMQRTRLSATGEKPIIQCRVNKQFAFIECASAEDANKVLNLNGIPFMNSCLRVSRPSKYAGPHIPTKTWQEITGQPLPPNVTPLSESSAEDKVNRELFVGNTTPEMTEKSLMDFLGKAIEQAGLTSQPGNPITACRLNGKFAFIELRSVEETTKTLNLNNIPYMGTQLRVGRPSKYVGPETPHGNWEDILAKYMSGDLKLAPKDEEKTLTATTNATKPTRIVELKNMLAQSDLESDNDYNEVLEDTKDVCSQFGTLTNIVIPRSGPGATKIFLEYNSIVDATKSINGLSGRTFDGRKVDANYYDEEKFVNKDFS